MGTPLEQNLHRPVQPPHERSPYEEMMAAGRGALRPGESLDVEPGVEAERSLDDRVDSAIDTKPTVPVEAPADSIDTTVGITDNAAKVLETVKEAEAKDSKVPVDFAALNNEEKVKKLNNILQGEPWKASEADNTARLIYGDTSQN
jgi:hypothetical protein